MTDNDVAALLDSPEPLVVIEAPAGCGKTFQGASYARRLAAALGRGRILILTHTHSACAEFAKETNAAARKVEIRTIDSLVVQIATIYHKSLDLPSDPSVWARQQKKESGFHELGLRVARLLADKHVIAAALADRYPFIIADEHQDSSAEQHEIIMKLNAAGSRLRVFGDPMQRIYGGRGKGESAADKARWVELRSSGSFAELEYPHRWRDGSPELGTWVLRARESLRNGQSIDLKSTLPFGLRVLFADNLAEGNSGYRLGASDRAPIDGLIKSAQRMLVLSGQNATAKALRAFWNRRIPLWEGHTREPLGNLVAGLTAHAGDAVAVAEATIAFIEDVCVGFSRSSHGDRLGNEIKLACAKQVKGKPAHIQDLARYILEEPNHFGVAKCLKRLIKLVDERTTGFDSVFVDHRCEFREAMRLEEFAEPEEGLAEITRRRSFARPMPPLKSISTIHKAKGLECENALIIPCDSSQFTDTEYSRCKLYVALSRAKRSLTLILPRASPSPLFKSDSAVD